MTDDAWIRAAIDGEEAAALTARLVAIRSYPGEEGAVQRAIAAWLTENSLAPEMQPTEGDRPNVLAWVHNGDGPTFMLNGHVDTVLAVEGWSRDPWQGWRDGDRLYGLGACDMKSGVVAAMLATRALAQNRDRWRGTALFTSVVDEEAYSVGARARRDGHSGGRLHRNGILGPKCRDWLYRQGIGAWRGDGQGGACFMAGAWHQCCRGGGEVRRAAR